MFDLDPGKLLVLGFLALVVLGPERLPQAARTVGRIVGQLRAMSASFQTEVKDALGEPGEAITSALGEFRATDIRRSVRQAVTTTVAPFTSNGNSANGHSSNGVATGANGVGSTVSPGAGPEPSSGMPVSPDDPSFN